MTANNHGYKCFRFAGMALDPIHVGTGGSRLGRVDNTIVRDPVTRIPKIPGSSLAGVLRAYTAMSIEGKYPRCAGQGQTASADGQTGHCCNTNEQGQEEGCEVCTVFGYAKGRAGESGGFAGLAAFSDVHVLLFPAASRTGPQWVTCPASLFQAGIEIENVPDQNTIYRKESAQNLNLGWLLLPVQTDWAPLDDLLSRLESLAIPEQIIKNVCVVSDKLYGHIVNSNLEVRTSVSIDPSTGAAKDNALFTYEAIPRSTVLSWEVTCRNPKHFKNVTAVQISDDVKNVVVRAHPFLEHLGIGGMGTRGMGRLRVLGNGGEDSERGAS